MEGLCGNCDNDKFNDIRLPSGETTTDIEQFKLSWLYDEMPGNTPDVCKPVPTPICAELPPGEDPCQQILDYDTYKEVKFDK